MPVAQFIERNWSPAHAAKIVGQVHKVTDTVDEFLRQYESIIKTQSYDTIQWDRRVGAGFLTLGMMVSQELLQWATDIEARGEKKDTKSKPESREALMKRAERYVRVICKNAFPGLRRLTRELGCANRPASLMNAIKSSAYLRARQAEYESKRKLGAAETSLTDIHLDQIAQEREQDPSEALDILIAEQESDMRKDRRRTRKASRKRSK